MALVRYKRFWTQWEAERWRDEHVPATGMIMEGHNGIQPYWDVVY